MTRIEIEVFGALRRMLAETAPDAIPALLARLEEERLRGETRLAALVDVTPGPVQGADPVIQEPVRIGRTEKRMQTAVLESDIGGLNGVEPATSEVDAGGLKPCVHPAVVNHGGQ